MSSRQSRSGWIGVAPDRRLGLESGPGVRVRLAEHSQPRPGRPFVDTVDELPEHGTGVADEAHSHRAVVADRGGVDVDLDDPSLGVEARRLAVGEHEVEPGAGHEHDVRVAEGAGARGGHVLRVGEGEDASRGM